ncbi:TonB-dependent receptor domain-containing protein [Sphingomonas koreensis]
MYLSAGMTVPVAAVSAQQVDHHTRRFAFDIPAGRLSDAIVAIGRQSGVNIATAEPGAARIRTPAVNGAMSIDSALRHLLAASGLVAVWRGPNSIRIERARKPPPSRRVPPPSPPPSSPQDEVEIVVTATKQPVPLEAYPGAANVIDLNSPGMRRLAGQGTQALVETLPVLASTSLGPGREKLFLRGIADSSFTGPTQATVGQYLGEVQLNYNAPDPNLSLYDMERVEVLQGPQGTLYGAGSLGGIVQLIPRAPVLGRWKGEILAAIGSVAHGKMTGDAAAVLNAPIGSRAAVRLLGYVGERGGYIDDVGRGLRDVNRASTIGARGSIKAELGRGWTIDLGGTFQRIVNHDAQYSEANLPPLSRASAVAQPATNRFLLAQISARKIWDDGLELVNSVALVRNHLFARHDSTGRTTGVSAVDTYTDAELVTAESRLSRRFPDNSGWLVGAHATISDESLIRMAERTDAPAFLRGVGNRIVDTALFGQATVRISPIVTATVGARLSYVALSGFNILPGRIEEEIELGIVGNGALNLAPGAALLWRVRPDLSAFIRYQRGYRLGGYTLTAFTPEDIEEGGLPYRTFRPDKLDMVEIGSRFGRQGRGLRGGVALSIAQWRDIQADLNGVSGPYTANIGSGRVFGLEASVNWAIRPELSVSASVFLADSTLYRPTSASDRRGADSLPNIPPITARMSIDRRFTIGQDAFLTLSGSGRYVGRSWLGVGRDLRILQGNYLETNATAELTLGRRVVFLDIQNILDVRGNRFSLGNPLSVAVGTQRTPLQPRMIRIGFRTAF